MKYSMQNGLLKLPKIKKTICNIQCWHIGKTIKLSKNEKGYKQPIGQSALN